MSDNDERHENVSEELGDRLDELSEELRDPERADRRIEDQGVEGALDEDEG